MLAISIVIIIVGLMLAIYGVYSLRNTHKINQEVDEQNEKIKVQNRLLAEKQLNLQNEINVQRTTINNYTNQLDTLQKNISTTEKNQEELSRKAFENYQSVLEKHYEEVDKEYDKNIETLKESYATLQQQLMEQAAQYRADLDQLKATRAAALQAQLKEKEIKEQLAFYCVKVKQSDLDDIKVLDRIRPQLNNQRILSMLIWSTFYQKPMTALCNNVVGTTIKCGIYKITNQKNNMCYIGQSVNISDRFKQHAKCGLGIDTPQKNKLYQAMLQDGLHNFSFEILEECPRDQLDEKEKYYINLYQAYEFGYNSNIGNNNKGE